MDGLAYRLHRSIECGYQAWVQSLLTGVILSHRSAQAGIVSNPLSGGCEALEIPDGLNPSWRSPLLLRRAYPMSE
jgi:hypothetical protein